MPELNLKDILFEELGYINSPEIKEINQISGRSVTYKLQVYNAQDVQIAYFCQFDSIDNEGLWELHRAIWNESKTPLLYVILPTEIRIYNTYALPSQSEEELDDETRLLRHLKNLTEIESARRAIRDELYENHYDRIHLETGAFWDSKDGQKINKETRADNRLLKELDSLRRKLLASGLSNQMDYAYALIGRSIFIRYLEDRNILRLLQLETLHISIDDSFINLLHDKEITYQFFQSLTDRFKGDIFPILDNEEDIITQEHLNLIADFLDGTILDTGQTSFWAYNFEYIPIELVSGIYDTFLNTSEKKKAGTYYTPHTLADFILEETMPDELTSSDMKILDPACGSGVFLVRAYQRIIKAWNRENNGQHPSPTQLGQLMTDGIYGVDINESAIRIAIFSLYLTLLSNLDIDDIVSGNFIFPTLIHKNLLIGDFFATSIQKSLRERTYDRVVGNPPWKKSALTKDASQWIKHNNYPIGNKQIAQAFILLSPEICNKAGEVALLAPAKSTINVTSSTHRRFQTVFLKSFSIRVIFNFSTIRHELFSSAIHPATAIFYSSSKPSIEQQSIIYVTPKPSVFSKRLGSIVLHTSDVKYLNVTDVLATPVIWNMALWGTKRDLALIKKLSGFQSLEQLNRKHNFRMAEGFQLGGSDKNPAEWLMGMPIIPTEKVTRYHFNTDDLKLIKEKVFHRPKEPEIFTAPMTLIRQSPTKEGKCIAVYSTENIAFRHKIISVTGTPDQEDILKWIALFVNSSIAQYWHFLTSASWGVERDNIITYEYRQMPLPLPDSNVFNRAIEIHDEIVSILSTRQILSKYKEDRKISSLSEELDSLIFDVLGLYSHERQLIEDTIRYGIGFFNWGKLKGRRPHGSDAVKPPSIQMLKDYAEIFTNSANTLLRYEDSSLQSTIYQNGAPLTIVGFKRVQTIETQSTIIRDSDEIRSVLRRLDKLLLEQKTSSLYVRRQVRIYDSDWMYIVRPSEQRFWSKSQALVDADEAIAEWLSQPSSQTTEGIHG